MNGFCIYFRHFFLQLTLSLSLFSNSVKTLCLYVFDLEIFKILNELFCLVNIQMKENKLMLIADGNS